MSDGSQPQQRRTGGFGPSVVVLSLLSATWIASRGAGERPAALPGAAVPSAADAIGEVPVWLGQHALSADGAVRARLTPLHAEPDRQAFDARALAQRLGLGAGEPWRLELAYEAPPDAPPLGLSDIAIEDASGRRIAPAAPAADGRAAAGAAVDPLRALVRAPRTALRPGGTASLVLWGDAPGAGARVVGVDAVGAPSIELAEDRAAGDGLSRPLTRVAAVRSRAATQEGGR